ncbi:MAG: arginine deiminase-related protein, partial [Pseudomonadota bacterium]
YSPRTHEPALSRFCRDMDFEPVGFNAVGDDGTAVYHTNVMMCVGEAIIVACVDSIVDAERARVVRAMEADHALVPISIAQMNAYAGNMLELRRPGRRSLMVLSSTAYRSLDGHQLAAIEASCELLPVNVPTIETAGGSVRCMLAEIFLPTHEGPAA